MIDLTVLKENPELAKNVKLEVTAADLIAFGESWQKLHSEEKPHEKDEVYLTANQLAEIYQVSLVTIWSWDKKGITRPVRIGNQKRYRKSDIEKFLEKEQDNEKGPSNGK